MCTVIIHVPVDADSPTRMLAIRDENPDRPWRDYGAWWPHEPALRGVFDVTARGAWLATTPGRLAVALNRDGEPDLPPSLIGSRGSLVTRSALGETMPERFDTHGVNLVSVAGSTAHVQSWDGRTLRTTVLEPGTHMIAHGDVDDDTTRIRAWKDDFAAASTDDRDDGLPWWTPWLNVLSNTATGVGPMDDRAIIRDNRPLGYPTLSLLVCAASVTSDATNVASDALVTPGTWNSLDLT